MFTTVQLNGQNMANPKPSIIHCLGNTPEWFHRNAPGSGCALGKLTRRTFAKPTSTFSCKTWNSSLKTPHLSLYSGMPNPNELINAICGQRAGNTHRRYRKMDSSSKMKPKHLDRPRWLAAVQVIMPTLFILTDGNPKS